MSRDLVLATLTLVLCGAGIWISSWLPPYGGQKHDEQASGGALERDCWLSLWRPIFPAAIALAILFGWALQEPAETDELLRPLVIVAAIPLGFIWFRSAARAALALRRPRPMPPAATFGLWRPRVIIEERLRRALDGAALAAVIAHERAHATHLDPLRIWLAQIATDAQWPSPAARERMDRWLVALELARDEEARREGIRGEDLAAAVVAVIGMTGERPRSATACLTGAEMALASRIRRLLVPLSGESRAFPRLGLMGIAAALIVAVLLGLEFGDPLLRALPFIAH